MLQVELSLILLPISASNKLNDTVPSPSRGGVLVWGWRVAAKGLRMRERGHGSCRHIAAHCGKMKPPDIFPSWARQRKLKSFAFLMQQQSSEIAVSGNALMLPGSSSNAISTVVVHEIKRNGFTCEPN